MTTPRKPRARKPPERIKLLDVACGIRKKDGAVGIDLRGDVDILHDLLKFPWPIADESVENVFCSHFVEHIPHYRPEWDGRDGWWMFWNEINRILVPEGEVEIIHPYSRNDRAFYDPTHERFIHEVTWYYLNREWRDVNMIGHTGIDLNFDVIAIEGQNIPEKVMARNEDYRAFAQEFYFNVIADLHVHLRKRNP